MDLLRRVFGDHAANLGVITVVAMVLLTDAGGYRNRGNPDSDLNHSTHRRAHTVR